MLKFEIFHAGSNLAVTLGSRNIAEVPRFSKNYYARNYSTCKTTLALIAQQAFQD